MAELVAREIVASKSKMSQPAQTYHVDSRLPVSPSQDESDPSHPKNITKTNLMVQNQATADQKYDISPPPRVEGFMSMPLPTSFQMLTVVFVTSIIIAIVSISFLTFTSNRLARIVFIIATVVALNYAIISLEKCAVYNLSP